MPKIWIWTKYFETSDEDLILSKVGDEYKWSLSSDPLKYNDPSKNLEQWIDDRTKYAGKPPEIHGEDQ